MRERPRNTPLIPRDPQAHLDNLISEFPKESQEKLEERIEGKEIAEQIAIVEDALKKRREILTHPRYSSNRLRMIERVPDSVFERFVIRDEHQVELGRGENGRVFEYKSSEGEESSTVFKMLIRPTMRFQNTLLEEGAYQADVSEIAKRAAELRIGVPSPFYIASSSKGYVLAMEKVPGYSAKDISKTNISIPASVDLDLIEQRLVAFVDRMHAEGFYHRDLREGNIMIDFEAGDDEPIAYVIDFGLATKATSAEQAYRDLDAPSDYVMIHGVIEQLKERQRGASEAV